jgi:cysteinyl-tRNA synthetase
MEELFFRATDDPCDDAYCLENLGNTRALRDAGKFVLAVDYAVKPESVAAACARYRAESFAGYVAVLELDQMGPPCPN